MAFSLANVTTAIVFEPALDSLRISVLQIGTDIFALPECFQRASFCHAQKDVRTFCREVSICTPAEINARDSAVPFLLTCDTVCRRVLKTGPKSFESPSLYV